MHAHIARICTSFIDVPDRIAIAIYFAGCTLRCKDCQNRELWDSNNGARLLLDEVLTTVDEHPIADTVVFLGGEPTDQQDFLIALCEKIKNKDCVLYTGREFEVLPKALTKNLSMVICGPYRSELHVGGWPASSNQRIFEKKEEQWFQPQVNLIHKNT